MTTYDRCRMKACSGVPNADGWCDLHLRRLLVDIRWCPSKFIPGAVDEHPPRTLCGVCGTEIMFLRRIDDERQDLWAIEADSHPAGRCTILGGGFRVLSPGLAASAGADGLPLFRTHPPVCPKRPTAETPAVMPE